MSPQYTRAESAGPDAAIIAAAPAMSRRRRRSSPGRGGPVHHRRPAGAPQPILRQVRRVDTLRGPGNAFIAEARRPRAGGNRLGRRAFGRCSSSPTKPPRRRGWLRTRRPRRSTTPVQRCWRPTART